MNYNEALPSFFGGASIWAIIGDLYRICAGMVLLTDPGHHPAPLGTSKPSKSLPTGTFPYEIRYRK